MSRNTRPCAAGCADGMPADGVMLCRGCIAKLKADLAGFEDLRQQLVVTLARQDHIGPAAEGRAQKVAEPGSDDWAKTRAYNQRASHALHEIRNELVGWVRMIEEETGDPLPANRIVQLAAWLTARLAYIAKHEAARDIWLGVRAAYRTGTRAIDLPRDKTRIMVGPCPENEPAPAATESDPDPQSVPCPGMVIAFIPYDTEYRPSLVCQHADCGHETHEWTAEQWSRLGKRIQARQGIVSTWDDVAVRRLAEAVMA